jgi:pimeloyl-ACP methyl ester carboxylesterase
MYDYVELIRDVKSSLGLEDRAVIVGGGSYGGMLAAWLRMKYPQWF